MPELQVKKVVAVCFLEAAKLALEHLGAFRLQLSQQSVPGPQDLPRTYGDIRRLRDYLQRCVSAYQEMVPLDLSDGDASLLVACCRRAVEAIEVRLTDRVVAPDEKQWLTRKRTVLSDWAVELAAKPLIELPLTRLSTVVGESVRGLTTRLHNKVFGDVSEREKIVPPKTASSTFTHGLVNFGESTPPDDDDPPPKGAKSSALAAPGGPDVELNDEAPWQDASLPPLLDRRTLKDPRLRSLIGLDLTAFNRCVADGDHRLATVLLASIAEAALLDHAIQRRSELGLSGTPDTWNPQELLLRAMGEAAEPKDRALAFHLFASRNLLRPSLQMVTPAVVTAASFERLYDFVGRALYALGFGSAAKAPPAGTPRTDDTSPA